MSAPPTSTSVLLRLSPGDLVLDAGAYCGASTIAFAKAVGLTGHVVALEPDPDNRAALYRNLREHGIRNVSVVDAGLWSETSVVSFVADGNLGSAVASVLPRRGRTLLARMLSLADALELARQLSGLPRVTFIKLDIEGAEVPVLRHADALRGNSPRLIIEPHRARGTDSLTDVAIISCLEAAGYHCQRHTEAGCLLVSATPTA